jgi:phosphoribosylglycinamide formyltransferase-1
MTTSDSKPLQIILFASGNGSNALNICHYFKNHPTIRIAALFCNNPQAGVIKKIEPLGIPVHLFSRKEFNDKDAFLPLLMRYDPSLIVLAGFLWLVPEYLVKNFSHRIINIHPALLPKYGGKGMYGMHVHQAVAKAKEKEHGITIHFVNEKYDEGQIIFQAKFDVSKGADAETLAKHISQLEMTYFPQAIERVISK